MKYLRRTWILAMAITALVGATSALAQVAPQGSHQAGRSSDTGFAGRVNSSGGYNTSIPLDLVPAKGGLPIPVQVTYGGRAVGAAGIGWDVPISYILRDTTYAHRLPGYDPSLGAGGSPPLGTERLTLVFDGRPMLLMRKGNQQTSKIWVPVHDGPQIEVHDNAPNGSMFLYDGAGRTYVFINEGPVGRPGEPPTGHVPLLGGKLYTLAGITAPGNSVVIEYLNILYSDSHGTGLEIDLHSIVYNSPTSASSCGKNRIVLTYNPPAPTALAMTMVGDGMLVRKSTLKWIDMHAFDACGRDVGDTGDVILRRHVFNYGSDPDTGLPQLISADLLGRAGTPEGNQAISLGTFTYGAASVPISGSTQRALFYTQADTVALPATNDVDPVASLGLSIPTTDADINTWHELIDVTGDGRPDLVYRNGTSMMLAVNRPADMSGRTNFSPPIVMPVASSGPVLSSPDKPLQHETTAGPPSGIDPENTNRQGRVESVYRQMIDVNGDGRVDIIDAHETPGQWVFYLNTPGPDPSQIVWARRPVDMTPLIAQFATRGYNFGDGYLPLTRRHSGMESQMDICFLWDTGVSDWLPIDRHDSQHVPNCSASYQNAEIVEFTYTEWEVRDVNSDGYVDVIFNHAPPMENRVFQKPGFPGVRDQQAAGLDRHDVVLDAGNTIEAVVNVLGPLLTGSETEASGYPFSAPIQLWGPSMVTLRQPQPPTDPGVDSPPAPTVSATPTRSCGVGLWVEPRPEGTIVSLDFVDVATQYCALADVNGDGLVDRIEGLTAFLQGGNGGFGGATITLPGYAQGHTDRHRTACCDDPNAPCEIAIRCDDTHPCLNEPHICNCVRVNNQCTDLRGTCIGHGTPGPTAIDFHIDKTYGLKDVNGDGILDYLNHFYDPITRSYFADVRFGTGAGFTRAIVVSMSQHEFGISQENVFCAGGKADMVGGLYDLDGDGPAEMVFVDGSVYALNGAAKARDAGRLVSIDNGHGAITKIVYASAKDDPTTPHAVPFPEIVVASVETDTTSAPAQVLTSAVHRAFGNAQMVFDALQLRWGFGGYRRTVETQLNGNGGGMMTITDTSGIDPFLGQSSSLGRFLVNAKVGRPLDVTILSGNVGGDAWAGLTVNVAQDLRVIGATHYEYAAKLFEEPRGTTPAFCAELAFPYDYRQSLAGSPTFRPCVSHGFVYTKTQTSWRGTAAPTASAANVTSQVQIADVDDFGNVLDQSTSGDGDPSLRTLIAYATPAQAPGAKAPRVLGAPKERTVLVEGSFVAQAFEQWQYDDDSPDHPTGVVTNGFVTSHAIFRLRGDSAVSLGGDRSDIKWGVTAGGVPTGMPVSNTFTREGEDGHITGIRKVLLSDYDVFHLVPATVRVVTVGLPGTPAIPALTMHVDYDPFTLAARSVTDPNGTVRGQQLDGLDRVTMTTIAPPVGARGALSATTYAGFTKGEAGPRSVVHKAFTDPVATDQVATATGRTSTMFLDALGREAHVDVQLGADYQNQIVIASQRSYDILGRVAYEADPYLSTQNPVYATSRYFKDDGTPDCVVRGPMATFSPIVNRTTDESQEIYPTCFSRSFADHREVITTYSPDSLLVTSPQSGVTETVTRSVSGMTLSHTSSQAGTVIEYADYAYDSLGRMRTMKRYRDPANRANSVTTSMVHDSFGLVLELDEPDAAPRIRHYDSWGALVDEQWVEGTTVHQISSRYDALGRVVHREESTRVGVQVNVDPDTVNDYSYDTAVNVTGTATLNPTNVLGRLARAVSPTQSVVFSYDGFGNVAAKAFSDGQLYVQQQRFHGDGSLDSLDLLLPDHTVDDRGSDPGFSSVDEQVVYRYDTAGRVKSVSYTDCTGGPDLASGCTNSIDLFQRTTIDVLGRLREGQYGHTTYSAAFADTGRRLLTSWGISSTVAGATHSRQISFPTGPGSMFDPVGRERERTELRDGDTTHAVTYSNVYDALGRLTTHKRVPANHQEPEVDASFTYDALGNITSLFRSSQDIPQNAALTYQVSGDLDRICRVRYGADSGIECNVQHDLAGNITQMPTSGGGSRIINYLGGGAVRSISDDLGNRAQYSYGAFGEVTLSQIDSLQPGSTRHDRHYGPLIDVHDELVDGAPQPITNRTIPLPGGVVAARHGVTPTWIFAFSEDRGVRFYTDQAGNIVQDVDYQAYGALQSTTPVPDEQRVATYSIRQWNGGDTLHKLGVTQLGARLYDPIIGRFLSRDPLLIPRSASTTNPYAFAMNDPINLSDSSGLDPDPGDSSGLDLSAGGLCTGEEECGGSADNLIPVVTTAKAIGWKTDPASSPPPPSAIAGPSRAVAATSHFGSTISLISSYSAALGRGAQRSVTNLVRGIVNHISNSFHEFVNDPLGTIVKTTDPIHKYELMRDAAVGLGTWIGESGAKLYVPLSEGDDEGFVEALGEVGTDILLAELLARALRKMGAPPPGEGAVREQPGTSSPSHSPARGTSFGRNTVGAAERPIPKFTRHMKSQAQEIARGSRIDKVDMLVEKFGGKPSGWRKMKTWTEDGAEIHYYEHHGIGRVGEKWAGFHDPF